MRKSFSLTAVISLALVSAIICQCNMVTMMAATPADHCTPAEEGDAPMAQCCFTQGPPVEFTELTVPIPSTGMSVFWAETAVVSQLVPELSFRETIQMPPERDSLTHQICVLLI